MMHHPLVLLPCDVNFETMQEYDVEVVTFILERSVIVGLALDGDRTKRCSHGEIYATSLLLQLSLPCSTPISLQFWAQQSK